MASRLFVLATQHRHQRPRRRLAHAGRRGLLHRRRQRIENRFGGLKAALDRADVGDGWRVIQRFFAHLVAERDERFGRRRGVDDAL